MIIMVRVMKLFFVTLPAFSILQHVIGLLKVKEVYLESWNYFYEMVNWQIFNIYRHLNSGKICSVKNK